MSVRKAKSLYEKFREAPASRARKVTVTLPKAVAIMGYCNAIEYETSHAGKARSYRHKFAKGSRALLCAGPEKSQLYLIGGRFHVTERGIVDLTPKGREIED